MQYPNHGVLRPFQSKLTLCWEWVLGLERYVDTVDLNIPGAERKTTIWEPVFSNQVIKILLKPVVLDVIDDPSNYAVFAK